MADSKISSLTALAGASVDTAADQLVIADTSASETKKITPAALATAIGAPGVAVKRYIALLTQTGTAAPVATVLENSLGGTPVWSRTGTGTYYATLSGVLTSAKTLCRIQNFNVSSGVMRLFYTLRVSSDACQVVSVVDGGDATPTLSDGILLDTVFEIEVYP